MTVTEQQSVKTACWSCGSVLTTGAPFCGVCGKVQAPVAGVTYFDAFGLTRKLGLETANLERTFYKLSRKLHPDVYAQASEHEQQWSLEQTSLLNDAYRTLKNPVMRTEYLLRLEGVEIEQDRSAENGAKKESRVPPDLLEEVFELNMQLEEMRMNRKMGEDDPQLRGDLEKAKAQFEGQMAESDSQLQALWTKWDAALDEGDEASKTETKDKMVALLDRRRYVRNLVRDVNEALDN
ncbi:Fe-S protein assembly co-chaperone HscB [Alloacidobacterium sp.]|uniref:Fe-S protein assembly co-chaperone HscB n=1 Tax=Alloacidobacterium sp. TaxID=2951999 RepID=UPI002D71D2E4|nr:Fe-S protein assembly co-chaperone HscB [Alloacidobacterium sp.]HYK35244.1 Fe-S protein assembly co-chaperone HscB [Alloacidobacterium sp.]